MPVRKLCELFIQQAKRYKEINRKTKGKHTHNHRREKKVETKMISQIRLISASS